MKNWSRIVLLASALVMASFATVDAYPYPPGYGTCYIICDGGQYAQSYGTSLECCSGNYLCPDNSYPMGITWSPDEGWPFFCPPYAD
jgi:hypothetical protein